tara:strand:- start:3689 stop:5845 length:2157 start_codon:yes stop_codon:yes gene_type:complete
MINFNSKNHFITINSDSSNNTKLFIKGKINKSQESLIDRLYSNNEKKKNRIILSARTNKFANQNNIFIHKYNLKNNIKFIFKNNDFSKPRILFVKSYKDIDNDTNDLTLFDSTNNFSNLDNVYMIYKNLDIDNKKFKINLNFYKNYKNNNLDSDYYKFKLNDFSLNSTNISNIQVINDYSNNKLINNYNISDFSNLLYLYDNSSTISNYDIDSSIESSFNFLLYNKPSANNISSKTSNNYTKITFDNNESIIFLPFKKYDYYSDKAGKILFYKDCIHFNSLILDSCSNFYTNYYNKNNNISPYKYYDTSNTIFLSLGNFMSGFTQKNLFKQTVLQHNINNNNININKILFRKYYEPTSYIIPSELSNNYLIEKNDYSYNYIFDNILYGYNNSNNLKNTTLNLNNYYYNNYDFSKNIYLNSFNNYNIKNNNINNILYESSNIIFNYSDSDVCYNNIYNLKITPPETSNITSITNYNLNFDFRYNYGINFDVNYLLNIDYNDTINDNVISINNINFFKIDFLTNFDIPEGSVFNNVEEILIYYDPYNTNTPEKFRYPNNNFDICRNFQLDFLNTVIENIPGALTSTTNTSFIPERNGSNYSKKMINGLIGFNNVPKLLAIKPYDESILIGRGFNNQLNFDNGTLSTDELQLTDQEIVNRKYESQRNNTLQNNTLTSKQRFANISRSRIRNRNISSETYNSADKPPQISKQSYKTFFRFNY